MIPKLNKKTTMPEGKWLELKKISYNDKTGKERNWESAERVKCAGAVTIIANLNPSGRLALIRQYRPPADKYIIEFPAGLIDAGETPNSTACRELLEETGYTGKIIKVCEAAFNSPGMTNESVQIVLMEINENNEKNKNVTPRPEDSEDIETILIPKSELARFINRSIERGDGIDSKVMSFALADEFPHA